MVIYRRGVHITKDDSDMNMDVRRNTMDCKDCGAEMWLEDIEEVMTYLKMYYWCEKCGAVCLTTYEGFDVTTEWYKEDEY